jgi:hypothetical protein
MTNNWCEQNQRGMQVVEIPTYEQWEQTGGQLSLVEDSLPFLIGDWINIGMDQFGEDWSQASSKFKDKKSGTLSNYASVCRKIPYDIRRTDLTFSHHQHVRALDQEDMIRELAYAADNEINSEDFRKHIQDKYNPQPEKDEYLEGLKALGSMTEDLIVIAPEGQGVNLRGIRKAIQAIIEDYEFIRVNL